MEDRFLPQRQKQYQILPKTSFAKLHKFEIHRIIMFKKFWYLSEMKGIKKVTILILFTRTENFGEKQKFFTKYEQTRVDTRLFCKLRWQLSKCEQNQIQRNK